MRMHRGSSKDGRGPTPPSGNLPLSASSGRVSIVVEIARPGRAKTHELEVPCGALLRAVLRELGLSPEGCAVLVEDRSVPLDTPVTVPGRYVVVPTFSGG